MVSLPVKEHTVMMVDNHHHPSLSSFTSEKSAEFESTFKMLSKFLQISWKISLKDCKASQHLLHPFLSSEEFAFSSVVTVKMNRELTLKQRHEKSEESKERTKSSER